MAQPVIRRIDWRHGLIGCVLLCAAGFGLAQAPQAVPELRARVTDLAATLSADQRSRIETKLADFERQKGAQIALLIVPTVKPEGIAQYALRVVEAWQLGRRGIDDGVLLLVAKDDRQLRFEVGYGLEGALNDATAKRIISETITPRFRQGDFYGGLDAGIDAAIRVIGGEALPPPKPARQARAPGVSLEPLIVVGFVLIFAVGGVLRAIFGRFFAAGIVGAIAGIVASLLLSSLFVAILAGFIVFIVSLLAGISGGRGGTMGGRGGGFSSGGFGGGGGFSGGGGSFGGGGASGNW